MRHLSLVDIDDMSEGYCFSFPPLGNIANDLIFCPSEANSGLMLR